jgi:CubicO group peptidase (beta-lactamase class C family)
MNDHILSRFAGLGLFTGESQVKNFPRMADLFPSVAMSASPEPRPWPIGPALRAPARFEFEGRLRIFEETFKSTETAALLVLQNGVVRYERYDLTGGPEVPWISMSVAKSFVSALVGIALQEGHINDIEDPISDYIKATRGSAYHGVSIRNVLQMSSGARWNEDYSDPGSDIFGLMAALAGQGTLEEFVGSMSRDMPQGKLCRYNSGDTQALGLLLIHATGRPLADYMQAKLCDALGMTSPSAWLTDAAGVEAAFGGLNMTARDFARLGELFRNDGRIQGRQILPASWVRDSIQIAAPHLEPGRVVEGDQPVDLGYGYQWWIPEGTHGEFAAIGVYNQFVYVDPSRNVVAVKLSANPTYGTTSDEAENREFETIAFLRALAKQVEDTPEAH